MTSNSSRVKQKLAAKLSIGKSPSITSNTAFLSKSETEILTIPLLSHSVMATSKSMIHKVQPSKTQIIQGNSINLSNTFHSSSMSKNSIRSRFNYSEPGEFRSHIHSSIKLDTNRIHSDLVENSQEDEESKSFPKPSDSVKADFQTLVKKERQISVIFINQDCTEMGGRFFYNF